MEMSLRIKDEEIPSFGSMGFHKHLCYSWPYHPFVKLFETHLEMHFKEYKALKLDLLLPISEVVRKRWWNRKLWEFIRQELRGIPLARYNYSPDETQFFLEFPHLKTKWNLKKSAIVLRESTKDRFGKTRDDFNQNLKKEWMVGKKYNFMMRWLGLERKPHPNRRKYCNYYSDCLLYCRHYQCWKQRILLFPIILLVWLLFQIYYLWNTSVYVIQLPKGHPRKPFTQHNNLEFNQKN